MYIHASFKLILLRGYGRKILIAHRPSFVSSLPTLICKTNENYSSSLKLNERKKIHFPSMGQGSPITEPPIVLQPEPDAIQLLIGVEIKP